MASTAEFGEAEELRPDMRSDSAPATAAPFTSGEPTAASSRGCAQAGKPPKCPPGSWRSHSDTSRGSAGNAGGRTYKRSLSDEHLTSPVRLKGTNNRLTSALNHVHIIAK